MFELAPAYDKVDQLIEKQADEIEGTGLDKTILRSSLGMLMDKKLGSGEQFEIFDPDKKSLSEFGKKAVTSFGELLATVKGSDTNMDEFKERLEIFRSSVNMSDTEFKKVVKEGTGFVYDDDKMMGTNIKYQLDESKAQTQLLYAIANDKTVTLTRVDGKAKVTNE